MIGDFYVDIEKNIFANKKIIFYLYQIIIIQIFDD